MSNANNVSSTEARHQSTAPGEVHGRLRLMDCPGVVDTPRTRSRHRELRLFDAVGHLEHHTQRGTRHQPGDPVVEQDDANGVEPQWNPECQGEEDRFAGHEDHQLPSPRAGEWLVTDAAADELSEIIDKLPL